MCPYTSRIDVDVPVYVTAAFEAALVARGAVASDSDGCEARAGTGGVAGRRGYVENEAMGGVDEGR